MTNGTSHSPVEGLQADINKLQKEYLHLVYDKHHSELSVEMRAKRDVILAKVEALTRLRQG